MKIESILREPPVNIMLGDDYDYYGILAQRIKEAVLEAMPVKFKAGQVVNVPNLEYGRGYMDAIAEMRRKVGEL